MYDRYGVAGLIRNESSSLTSYDKSDMFSAFKVFRDRFGGFDPTKDFQNG